MKYNTGLLFLQSDIDNNESNGQGRQAGAYSRGQQALFEICEYKGRKHSHSRSDHGFRDVEDRGEGHRREDRIWYELEKARDLLGLDLPSHESEGDGAYEICRYDHAE